MSGKGDNRRPEDRKKFEDNYEKTFGNKELIEAPNLTTEADVEEYISHLKERLIDGEKLREIAQNNLNFLRSVEDAQADILKKDE